MHFASRSHPPTGRGRQQSLKFKTERTFYEYLKLKVVRNIPVATREELIYEHTYRGFKKAENLKDLPLAIFVAY